MAAEGVATSVLRKATTTLADLYIRVSARADVLSAAVTDVERTSTTRQDRSPVLQRLLGDERLNCLDVGARGGPDPDFTRYGRWFRYFLVEGDPEEAERLRAAGHVVIDKLVHDEPGVQQLHITRVPSKSSILEPGGHVLSYYGAGRLDQFEVVRTLTLPATNIAAIGEEHGVRFDVVKLDTQGTELHVLRGMGEQQPLVIKCEVSMAELYRDQDLFYELGRHLYDAGYLLSRLTMAPTRVPTDVPAVGFPVHGDAWFMPDWTRPVGLDVIGDRDLRWAALALMDGHQALVQHVAPLLPHGDWIADAIR